MKKFAVGRDALVASIRGLRCAFGRDALVASIRGLRCAFGRDALVASIRGSRYAFGRDALVASISSLRFAVVVLVVALASAARADIADDWLRYFEAKNVAANILLAPHHAPGVRHQEQSAGLVRPDAVTFMLCPLCDGKGEVISEAPDYGQWEGRLNRGKKERIRCPLCKGRKGWRAYFQPKMLLELVAAARQHFKAAHQANGDVAVGKAFVPRITYDAAGRKERKLVEEAYGKPCPRCEWSGIAECKTCKGDGVVKCKNKDCKSGWIVTKTTTTETYGRSHGFSRHGRHHSSKRETITVTPCPACGAAAMVVCPDCNGMRGSACPKCHGTGMK